MLRSCSPRRAPWIQPSAGPYRSSSPRGSLRQRHTWRGRLTPYPRSPKRKGPPERPMVPKASKAFRWQWPCLATLVNWTQTGWLLQCSLYTGLLDPGPLDAGLWTQVPSDAGCHRHWSLSALVVFGSGRCEKPARSTADDPKADPTNSPDDYQEFLHEI